MSSTKTVRVILRDTFILALCFLVVVVFVFFWGGGGAFLVKQYYPTCAYWIWDNYS